MKTGDISSIISALDWSGRYQPPPVSKPTTKPPLVSDKSWHRLAKTTRRVQYWLSCGTPASSIALTMSAAIDEFDMSGRLSLP